MRIQNNITAMNTHRMYTINNDNVAKSAEKLSSGYRINRAGDDAAGLAISEKMRSQIRGLNMATKNSQDAISLVQTAEGALQETQNMLQRMNELAVQAATGTNEDLDRTALAKEFEQLKREINDIAEQTTFNNMKILDGSMSYEGYVRSAKTSGINWQRSENVTATSGNTNAVADELAKTLTVAAGTSNQTALSAKPGAGNTVRVYISGDGTATQAAGTDFEPPAGAIAFETEAAKDDNTSVQELLKGGLKAVDDKGKDWEVKFDGTNFTVKSPNDLTGKTVQIDVAKYDTTSKKAESISWNAVSGTKGDNTPSTDRTGIMKAGEYTDGNGTTKASVEVTMDGSKLVAGDKFTIGTEEFTIVDDDDTNGADDSKNSIKLSDAATAAKLATALSAKTSVKDSLTFTDANGKLKIEEQAASASGHTAVQFAFTPKADAGTGAGGAGQVMGLAGEQPLADEKVTDAFGEPEEVTAPSNKAAGEWTVTVDASKLKVGDSITVDNKTFALVAEKSANAPADVTEIVWTEGTSTIDDLAKGMTGLTTYDPPTAADGKLTFSAAAAGESTPAPQIDHTRPAQGTGGNGSTSSVTATKVTNSDGTSTLTVEGMESLKAGDKFEIGGKTFQIQAAEGGPQALVAGDPTDPIMVTIAGATATNQEIADAINNAFADGSVKAEVKDGKLAITGADDKLTLKVGGQTIQVEDGDTVEPAANAKYTHTMEFDTVKMKDGDVFEINVGGKKATVAFDSSKHFTDKNMTAAEKFAQDVAKALQGAGVEAKGNAIIWKTDDEAGEMSAKLDTDATKVNAADNPANAVRIQVGALENEQLSISIDSMNTAGLGLDDSNLNTQNEASMAITKVRAAINKVSDQRATLGAMQNRLDHKIANLKVSSENLSAAESRIRDVDMASEMTNFTKNNILSQAATAMLAQANALPQNVLSLLG